MEELRKERSEVKEETRQEGKKKRCGEKVGREGWECFISLGVSSHVFFYLFHQCDISNVYRMA
jgi:hypothetical protein